MLLPAVAMSLVGFTGCNAELAVACFSVALAMGALTNTGCKAAMLDFAPAYAGIHFVHLAMMEFGIGMPFGASKWLFVMSIPCMNYV